VRSEKDFVVGRKTITLLEVPEAYPVRPSDTSSIEMKTEV
jgi:hypothetical protein